MILYFAEVTCDECESQEVFEGTFGFVSARNAGWMMLMGRHLCPFCQIATPKETPLSGHYGCSVGVPVEVDDIRAIRAYPIHLSDEQRERLTVGEACIPAWRLLKEEEVCGGFTRMRRRFGRAVATGKSACASWIGKCGRALRG